MSCRVICALVVLATSASGLQHSQQLPQLQSRRGWLANGIAVGAATLGAPKWTVADEGETAAVEPAAAAPVAKDAEVDSLTKMLLERSEKNRAINADLVKKQSIQNGMGGVDGVQVSRTKEQPKGEGEGGGIPGSSFFKDAADKVYSSDDTVYATYMKNGAIVELTRPELKELERIGRLTTSKRFGRGPRFYVVTDSAPANYYMVPLLKEKPSGVGREGVRARQAEGVR